MDVAQPDATAAARRLARARWGSTVVAKAVDVVVARRDELDETQLAELRQLTERAGDEREEATDDR